jgi:hypothetical protein
VGAVATSIYKEGTSCTSQGRACSMGVWPALLRDLSSG